jgi:hypothetical protein
MTDSPSDVCAYAYELPNPYHSAGGSGTLILDRPLRVGDRMKRSFPDVRQDPATQRWTSTTLGPEREWEVVAIEPTARDGEVATIRGYMGDKPPILQGRLILSAVG